MDVKDRTCRYLWKLPWDSLTRTVSTLIDDSQCSVTPGSMGACGPDSGRVCLRNLETVRTLVRNLQADVGQPHLLAHQVLLREVSVGTV